MLKSFLVLLLTVQCSIASVTLLAHNHSAGSNTVTLDSTGASKIVIQSVCSGNATAAPSDGQSNTYTAVGSDLVVSSNNQRTYFVNNPTTNAAQVYTPHCASSTVAASLTVFVFSGTSGGIDNAQQTGKQTPTSCLPNCTMNSLTPTVTGDLIISGFVSDSADAGLAVSDNQSGTWHLDENWNNSTKQTALAWQEYSSTTAIIIKWSFTSTYSNGMDAVLFLASAGGTTFIPTLTVVAP